MLRSSPSLVEVVRRRRLSLFSSSVGLRVFSRSARRDLTRLNSRGRDHILVTIGQNQFDVFLFHLDAVAGRRMRCEQFAHRARLCGLFSLGAFQRSLRPLSGHNPFCVMYWETEVIRFRFVGT